MALKFQKLEEDYLALLGEFNTLKCKLQCKTDSLLILGRELEKCKIERDQYKLMADQLRERYSALKRRIEGWGPSLIGVYDVDGLKCEREKSLVQLLCEFKEQNKILKSEAEDLKQRLRDAQGDTKILREEIAKSRLSSLNECALQNHIPFSEKESLVKQLEAQKLKNVQLTRDLQVVLDEKEDLITARDAYRHKFERLNQQLNAMLRGDQSQPVDIDGVLMENRYLQERIKQIEEEKSVMSSALKKSKALLEKKRTKGGLRFNSITAGLAVTAKQVEQILQNNSFIDFSNKASSSEFRSLILSLLEALSDKSIDLAHQKKTNKILGHRVAELEDKIKSMEVSSLWRFHDPSQISNILSSLELEESKNFENLSKELHISSNGIVHKDEDLIDNIADNQSSKSDDLCTVSELSVDIRTNSGFSDLDMLPTKDCSLKSFKSERQGSLSSCSHYSDSKLGSESPSPIHSKVRLLHSDSEVTPRKSHSSNGTYDSSEITNSEDLSELDVDNLPPHLKKMFIAALAEIENSEHEETIIRSPIHRQKSPIKEKDPNC